MCDSGAETQIIERIVKDFGKLLLTIGFKKKIKLGKKLFHLSTKYKIQNTF